MQFYFIICDFCLVHFCSAVQTNKSIQPLSGMHCGSVYLNMRRENSEAPAISLKTSTIINLNILKVSMVTTHVKNLCELI